MERGKPVYSACYLALVASAVIGYFLASLLGPGYVSKRVSNINVEGGLSVLNKVCSSQNINISSMIICFTQHYFYFPFYDYILCKSTRKTFVNVH